MFSTLPKSTNCWGQPSRFHFHPTPDIGAAVHVPTSYPHAATHVGSAILVHLTCSSVACNHEQEAMTSFWQYGHGLKMQRHKPTSRERASLNSQTPCTGRVSHSITCKRNMREHHIRSPGPPFNAQQDHSTRMRESRGRVDLICDFPLAGTRSRNAGLSPFNY